MIDLSEPMTDTETTITLDKRMFRIQRILSHSEQIGTYITSNESSKFESPIYRTRYIAVTSEERHSFLIEMISSNSSFDSSKIQEKFKHQRGKVIEGQGTTILTLEVIATANDAPTKNNLCYLWRIEESLDPIGAMNAQERALATYIRNHVTEHSTIILESGGQYRIERFLSAGGAFGTVYKASYSHNNSSRPCILKFQLSDLAHYEARILRAFGSHPNIVGFIDVGAVTGYFPHKGQQPSLHNPLANPVRFVDEKGTTQSVNLSCLVTEFINGQTIDHATQGAGISAGSAVRYTEQLCDAVGFIHQHQSVHLDIKPQNVMIAKWGEHLTIIDMGSVAPRGTIRGLGQGNHAAPEVKEYLRNMERVPHYTGNPTALAQCYRASEHARTRISDASDVFSVAAIFFTLLTGKNPRQIANPDSPPIQVEGVKLYQQQFGFRYSAFLPLLKRAFTVDPKGRFSNCRELKHAIQKTYAKVIRQEFLIMTVLFFLTAFATRHLGFPQLTTYGIPGLSASLVTATLAGLAFIIPLGQSHVLQRFYNTLIPLTGLAGVCYLITMLIGGVLIYVHPAAPGPFEIQAQQDTTYLSEFWYESALQAMESDQPDLVVYRFQKFLYLHRHEIGLQSAQIDAFDGDLANSLVLYVMDHPSTDLGLKAITISVVIQPDRLIELNQSITVYSLPSVSPGTEEQLLSKNDVIILLGYIDAQSGVWYSVWHDGNIYYLSTTELLDSQIP